MSDLNSSATGSGGSVKILAAAALAWLLYRVLFSAPAPELQGIPRPLASWRIFQFLWRIHNRTFHDLMLTLHETHGAVYRLVAPNGAPTIVINDAAALKQICRDNVVFRRSDYFTRLAAGLFDNALFLLFDTSDDKRWSRHRKMLQPAFGPSPLRNTAVVAKQTVTALCANLKQQIAESSDGRTCVNMKLVFSSLSLDIIGLVAFGHNVKAIEQIKRQHNEMDPGPLIGGNWHLLDICTFVPLQKRTLYPWPFWGMLGVASGSPELVKNQTRLKAFFDRIATERREKIARDGGAERWDMDVLERLLIANDFTEEEIFGELIGFFLAGHETTGNSLQFALLELYRNPEVAEKLYQEVKDVDLSEPTKIMETLAACKYLDWFCREVFRVHPIVPFFVRTATQDVTVMGRPFKKDTVFVVHINGVHKNPRYYANPLVFNPDRWDGAETTPGSFLTFGDGPHSCIGQKMANIEIKVILIELLKTFCFTPVPGHSVTEWCTITSGIREGLVSYVSLRSL
ncbi:hypothetical protein HDU91_004475 [Kappamyces sp. JEL0680]|nr:hypothetical protein HDU91_004475 [Kappamyces sp. JEL0680]